MATAQPKGTEKMNTTTNPYLDVITNMEQTLEQNHHRIELLTAEVVELRRILAATNLYMKAQIGDSDATEEQCFTHLSNLINTYVESHKAVLG